MAKGLIGIIGGSGLGDCLAEFIEDIKTENIDTPFGKPSAPVMLGALGQRQIAFLNRHGPGHKIAPSNVPFAANIFALKKLGVTTIIASGAVGSLREEIQPKELIVVDQVIDKTFRRMGSFFADIAAVHCELAQPFCTRMRKAILKAAKNLDTTTHDAGTYVCMEGPQFSTRAESLMHIAWGGDLIGMTVMPEAKLAREAQICYALIALSSDYDCWRPHEQSKDKQTLLAEIIGNLQAATNNAIELIKTVLETDSDLCDETCSCRKSLELAVWTTPDRIERKDKEKLKVLFD